MIGLTAATDKSATGASVKNAKKRDREEFNAGATASTFRTGDESAGDIEAIIASLK